MQITKEQLARNKIAKTARCILDGNMDYIEGIREIRSLWTESNLPLDDLYYSISLFEDDTDFLIKGDIQRNFSPTFIEEQKKWEKDYLATQKTYIDETLDELCKIPIIEEPEDPYAWPYDN